MSEKGTKKLLMIPLLCVAGAVLSFVSLKQHLALKLGFTQGPSFCNVSAKINCDAVAASPWAEIFGIPLAGFGLAYYGVIFVFALLSLNTAAIDRTRSSAILFAATFVGLAYSLYLLAITHFVIGAYCLMCLGMDAVNLLLFLFSWLLARGQGFVASLRLAIQSLFGFVLFVLGFGAAADSPTRAQARAGALVGLAILLAGVFAPQLVASVLTKEAAQLKSESAAKAIAAWESKPLEEIPINESADYSRGPQNAPIKIVEFSDYECPACRSLYGVLEELLKEYPDQVHFTLKNFPLDNRCNAEVKREFHRFACLFAAFTRCAGEQGKFWQAADFVFRLEIAHGVELEEISTLLLQGAEVFGLDQQALQSCVDDGRTLTAIKSDIEQGSKLNIQGTPTLWINGRRFELTRPEELKPGLQAIFRRILDSAQHAKSK